MVPDLNRAIDRLPSVIGVLGVIGAVVAWRFGGFGDAVAFLIGAAAAYFNFRLIERFVNRLLGAISESTAKRPKIASLSLFLQLALFLAGAFVILRFSGFNILVALYGFLVCPAAVILEAIYYVITYYGHS